MTYQTQEVNLSLPSLPFPLTVGSITWTDSFEQHPNGTILFTGVKVADLGGLTSSYVTGTAVTIGGVGFVVKDTAVQGKTFGLDLRIHQVTVNLQGKWQDPCEKAIPLRPIVKNGRVNVTALAYAAGILYNGPQFDFAVGDTKVTTFTAVLQANARRLGCYIYYSGVNAVELRYVNSASVISLPSEIILEGSLTGNGGALPVYSAMEVTGPFSVTKETKDSKKKKRSQFRPVEPDVKTIVSPSDNNSTFFLPALQPPESTVLRGLDSNFDNSGPRKTRTITTTVDGVTTKEEVQIWGYAYLASQIAVFESTPSGPVFKELLSSDPGQYWRQIESRISTYVYEPVYLSLEITEATTTENALIPFYIHPDYKTYASGKSGLNPSKNVKYLTKVITTGWQLARFVKEQDQGANSYSLLQASGSSAAETADVEYKQFLVQFFQLPILGGTLYELVPARVFNPDAPVPFSVDYQRVSEVEPDIREALKLRPRIKRGTTDELEDYTVSIITPDPNYVEPLYIMNEAKILNTFASTPSVEANPALPPPATPIPPTTPKWITVGEESSLRVTRDFIDAKQKIYSEVTASDKAAEADFTLATQESDKKVLVGDPPSATAIVQKWELDQTGEAPPNVPPSSQQIKRYIADSDGEGKLVGSETLDLPTAETREQAQLALETELRIIGAQSQTDVTVAWYYPSIMAGSLVQIGGVGSPRRVMRITHNLEYRGALQPITPLLVLSRGDTMTLGVDKVRTVTLTETVSPADENTGSNVKTKVRISLSYKGEPIGDVAPVNLTFRRNF